MNPKVTTGTVKAPHIIQYYSRPTLQMSSKNFKKVASPKVLVQQQQPDYHHCNSSPEIMQELRDCEEDMTAEIKFTTDKPFLSSGNDNTTDAPPDSVSSVNNVDVNSHVANLQTALINWQHSYTEALNNREITKNMKCKLAPTGSHFHNEVIKEVQQRQNLERISFLKKNIEVS